MTTTTKPRFAKLKRHYWNGKPLPDIFYEDPEPVEDGMFQQPTISKVEEALRRRFPDDFVSAGGFIMPDPEDGNNRFSPDTYISFGVNRERIAELEIPNYWTWEVGKMPEFALEVASESTADNDLNFKRDLYARLGFREYWLLDREGDLYGKPLPGLYRVGDGFEEYEVHAEPDGSIWAYSELLGLEFWWLSDASEWDPFDVRDPATGKSICVGAMYEEMNAMYEDERRARLAAEAENRRLREALREAGRI